MPSCWRLVALSRRCCSLLAWSLRSAYPHALFEVRTCVGITCPFRFSCCWVAKLTDAPLLFCSELGAATPCHPIDRFVFARALGASPAVIEALSQPIEASPRIGLTRISFGEDGWRLRANVSLSGPKGQGEIRLSATTEHGYSDPGWALALAFNGTCKGKPCKFGIPKGHRCKPKLKPPAVSGSGPSSRASCRGRWPGQCALQPTFTVIGMTRAAVAERAASGGGGAVGPGATVSSG